MNALQPFPGCLEAGPPTTGHEHRTWTWTWKELGWACVKGVEAWHSVEQERADPFFVRMAHNTQRRVLALQARVVDTKATVNDIPYNNNNDNNITKCISQMSLCHSLEYVLFCDYTLTH